MNKRDPSSPSGGLEDRVLAKHRRKQRARQQGSRSAWFGLGMFGLVGWSIALPTLAGITLGAWFDARWPSHVSWKLTFLFVGVCVGFGNALRWMHRESEQD